MAAALEFIRNNAQSFGGDPERITVFGQSAGSIATDLFTISPHTRGWSFGNVTVILKELYLDLFDKAIMFAGTKYLFNSVNKQSVLRQNAMVFAESVGFKLKPGLTEVNNLNFIGLIIHNLLGITK
jgi:carboxylesterase type B